MRIEIRITGFGGQGIVLAGYIIGKALALYDELNAVMTQSYGPEARGGASSANIVVSDQTIDYPFIQHPDVLIALSQEAYSKYRETIKKDAKVIIDSDLIAPGLNDSVFKIPATQIAEDLGRRIVANIVIVGYFCAVTGIVSKSSLEEAIRTSVKPNTVTLNIRAFNLGFDYADLPIFSSITGSEQNAGLTYE
jgi:2-oxoglutarate ferredoxin oxidoreductase subunit gamma